MQNKKETSPAVSETPENKLHLPAVIQTPITLYGGK